MGTAVRTRLGKDRGIGKGSLTGVQAVDSPSPPASHQAVNSTSVRPLATRLTALKTSAHDSSPSSPASSADLSEGVVSEIIVRTDDMDIDLSSVESAVATPQDTTTTSGRDEPTPVKASTSGETEEARTSFASSVSVLSDQSELSSLPPSVSSKATTPVEGDNLKEQILPTAAPARIVEKRTRRKYDVRPKISIPSDMPPYEYARQCIVAAESSRLNPYALHQEEYLILRQHLSHGQVTTYLNIRNGILRLWVKNPRIAVTRDEAIGCAKDSRWFDVARVCFDWLVRRGYINFGCVDVKSTRRKSSDESPRRKRRTVAVIGAGMSGLGCARQLEGLFRQYARQFQAQGEAPPNVVVIEGRDRIGGRVFSRKISPPPGGAELAVYQNKPFTAEMGGMIITGFERGNPLNVLVRGQLGLPYHALRSDTTIYDSDGKAVDSVRDGLSEKLFNDCLERVSEYKFKVPPSKLIEGNRDLMDEGKDSSSDGHKTISFVEETAAAQPYAPPVSEQNMAPHVNLVPVSSDRLTGRVHMEPGTPATQKTSSKARLMGWALKDGADEHDLDLDTATKRPGATLGSVMDNAIEQYGSIVQLNPQDLRLVNWHIANLEYSNAINYNQLSLGGWDIDAGNEWEGKHTMLIGGYQNVPYYLMQLPTPLDVTRKAPAMGVAYSVDGADGQSRIECEDGSIVEADYIVCTIPLGVLKHNDVEFSPPLPSSKTDVINRLGYGVLNKVVLVYEKAFWNPERDIFGVLQDPPDPTSLDQKHYTSRRGRFFQWFNVSNTSGLPVLLALMAGDAAHDVEKSTNEELIAEATSVLQGVYGPNIPDPTSAVVTRWASDPFSRGSYSSAGPDMRADDYDVMARSVGNLFFAGEHTCGTHPATVHGAYLSGLRAASEVLDAMLGPIEVPSPLIVPKGNSFKRKTAAESQDPRRAAQQEHEARVWEHVCAKIGQPPWRPQKVSTNPSQLFSKDNFERARKKCEEGRRPGKGKPGPNEVRVMSAKMWKDAPAEERKPFEDRVEEMKKAYAVALQDFNVKAAAWDRDALDIRAAYEKEHPAPELGSPDAAAAAAAAAAEREAQTAPARRKRRTKVSSYAEKDDSDVEMVV